MDGCHVRDRRDDRPTFLASRVDAVLLEGWMAGFEPLGRGAPALARHEGLGAVDAQLAAYAAWHEQMDAWVVLAVDDPAVVYGWRLQAEHAMAAAGRPGMSDAEVGDFVSRYMPAYHAFLAPLYDAARGEGVGGKPTLLVNMDEERRPCEAPAGC